MKTLHVDVPGRGYPVMIGPGLVPSAGRLLAGLGWNSAPIIVTNRTVFDLHGDSLVRSLGPAFGTPRVIRIGDGERFKNHATLMRIYREMIGLHADRRSWILAFGGGVVGDIAGFAAATFMRGIRFVMVPTTLLAQIDSSVGGKVAINVPQGKNLVGAFHHPMAVLSDTDVLETLPGRELASGVYEIVKHAAIRSEPLLRYLEAHMGGILGCRTADMTHVVTESVRIKAGVVARDEREEHLRMILNFGHTVGHAFETATGYRRFKHGEAVEFISEHHYARGASNTGISPTGLYHSEGDQLLGALMWLPPVMGAAKSVAPRQPHAVLSLHRLAIAPEAPRNSASYLISRAIKLLDDRWELCLTYADSGRGHVGTVYQATAWEYHGETRPRPVWRDAQGRMVSPKRGARTLTHEELIAEGAQLVGRFSKHKYVLDRRRRIASPNRPYPKNHPSLFAA